MKNQFQIVYALILAAVTVFVSGCSQSQDYTELIDTHKKLAGELVDNRLYSSAVEEYQAILDIPDVDMQTRANVCYLIGRIYYENLREYDRAAGYFLRATTLDPNSSFASTASKNLVSSLEKMGRLMDASRQLTSLTSIDTTAPQAGDVKVAQLGPDPIWLSELDGAIQRLPAETQKQLVTREAKVEFLRSYVATELMFRAALREGYDSDPKIKRRYEEVLHDLLVNKYVTEKVMPAVSIDTSDVRNFYVANRDTRYKSAPYDSVRARVFMDYQTEKAQKAFSDYVEKLSQAEKVEFFDYNVN